MRYRKNITFCADGGRRLPAQHFVSRPDTAWIGRGTAFSTPTAKRRCTLLAVWYVEQEEHWIILTDLPPEDAGPSWYALRFWIELGFKALKSLGWKWDKTRRTDPARVSRHWLVLSVATLLALAYGTRVEDAHDRRIAPGNLRTPPKTPRPLGAGRYGPSASSATASTGCGGCCSGAASGAGSGCCLSLGRNPNQPWRSPTMPLRDNTIHTPVRGALTGVCKNEIIATNRLATSGPRPTPE